MNIDPSTTDNEIASSFMEENQIYTCIYYINYKTSNIGLINNTGDINENKISMINRLLHSMSNNLKEEEDSKNLDLGNEVIKNVIDPYTFNYYFSLILLYKK